MKKVYEAAEKSKQDTTGKWLFGRGYLGRGYLGRGYLGGGGDTAHLRRLLVSA